MKFGEQIGKGTKNMAWSLSQARSMFSAPFSCKSQQQSLIAN